MTRVRRQRPDLTSLGGLILGIGLVSLGQLLDGGGVDSVLHLAAGVIVCGGTLGAVLISFSPDEVWHAARRLGAVFVDDEPSSDRLVGLLADLALTVRREGLPAIDAELDRLDEPFLTRGLRLVVDGHTAQEVRDFLDVDDRSLTDREATAAFVYESAGGYAPTFGILGAVLGLIQVMEHLTDPSQLGAGIAVAFVATAYGVGAANLIFLPIATKLRTRARRAASRRELMIEGIMAIHEGLSPRFLKLKLGAFEEPGTGVKPSRLRRAA